LCDNSKIITNFAKMKLNQRIAMEEGSTYNQQATDAPDNMYTYEHIVNWLKAAQQRQQEWQQEVKNKWAEKQRLQTEHQYETTLS